MQKMLEGKIVSTKMQKTVVIEILRKQPHPLYRKLMNKTKRLKADPGEFVLNEGDTVRISQTRPMAKEKNFKVVEIVARKEEK